MLLLAGAGCRGGPAAAVDPAATITAAWSDYRLNEFDLAAKKFGQALASAPKGSVDYFQALYGLATTWNLRLPAQDQKKDLAATYYERIIREDPRGEFVPWARLALARMKHLVPVGEDADYRVVRPAYQAIMDEYPGHLVAREAFIYLMSTKVATFQDADLEEAVAALTKFVSDTNDTSFFQPAYSLLAVSYNALGRQRERLDAEIRSLETTEVDPTNPYNEFSWQYWNIATIAEFEIGDFDLARKYYTMLLNEYPRDRRIYGVKVALQRMDDMETRLRKELAGP
jgi:tetratricopeptide (TPR) repeat protein